MLWPSDPMPASEVLLTMPDLPNGVLHFVALNLTELPDDDIWSPLSAGIIHLVCVSCMQVDALPPGTSLPPIDLAQRGHITSIDIHSFAAGRVASGAEQRMAAAAAAELRRGLARLGCSAAPVVQHAVRESSDSAVGDGSGVVLVAHTSAGCR
jgi:hypothetical protein